MQSQNSDTSTVKTESLDSVRNLSKETMSKICLRCLKCCITLVIPTNTLTPDFYRTRGIKIITMPNTSGNQDYAVMEHPCQHLTLEGCKIYDTRPDYCRHYLGVTDPFLSHCDLRDYVWGIKKTDIKEFKKLYLKKGE